MIKENLCVQEVTEGLQQSLHQWIGSAARAKNANAEWIRAERERKMRQASLAGLLVLIILARMVLI